MRLYCMLGGFMSWDLSALRAGHGMGELVECPTLMFLVEHPKGRLLFETGLAVEAAADPVGYYGPIVADCRAKISPQWGVLNQLAILGLTPDDIDYVAMSCLYYDHSGGLKHFPNSTIIVQPEELAEAFHPTLGRLGIQGDVYASRDLDVVRGFSFLNPDSDPYDVFGDGSVQLVRVPCHARGEQALLVRLPNCGSMLMPAGVLAQEFNFTQPDFSQGVLSGRLLVSPDDAVEAVMKLRNLAVAENATVLVHHDKSAWESYKHSPEFYD